jgi:hypothetical protein
VPSTWAAYAKHMGPKLESELSTLTNFDLIILPKQG